MTTAASQTLLVNGIGESADVARLDFSALGVSLTFSGTAGTTSAFVNALDAKTVITREQLTEVVTFTTEEYTVETETIVDESYVIPVTTEVAVRHYDSIATNQAAAPVAQTKSTDRELRALDTRLEAVLAEVAAERAAIEDEVTALAQGDQLDSESAREAVRAIAADVFGLDAAHAALTGSMVAALLTQSAGAPATSQSTSEPKPAAKPAATEPEPVKSP